MPIQSSHSRSWETATSFPGHKQTSSRPMNILVSCLHKTSDLRDTRPHACLISPSKGRPTLTLGARVGRRTRSACVDFSALIDLHPLKTSLRWRYFFNDAPSEVITDVWIDTFAAANKSYVVQTAASVIQRCLLMTTDPGDLVLDPTCGSGTTAYVAEQWGRRWITIDTSRVALALARARIMGARYPYYLLSDSYEGKKKEAEVACTEVSDTVSYSDIRQGFVYERVPHIQLRHISNNAEIDIIWEQFQGTLEPLREHLNASLGESWQEWEIPRKAKAGWPHKAQVLHQQWWKQRIARQREIDASIAAKADFEYLYDKPYQDNRKVRVAGPFTVESLSPHRILGINEDDQFIEGITESQGEYGNTQDFGSMILAHLRTAGVQQARKEDHIAFTSVSPWPGRLICAEGHYVEDGHESAPTAWVPKSEPGSSSDRSSALSRARTS